MVAHPTRADRIIATAAAQPAVRERVAKAQEDEIRRLRAFIANPPKHAFWGAGEPDCPRHIKAPNGELHTLKCKRCGLEDPRDKVCCAALAQEG